MGIPTRCNSFVPVIKIMELTDKIFSISTGEDFQKSALEVFRYQAVANAVYRGFLKALGVEIGAIDSVKSIPFMPIGFFRTHRVITEGSSPAVTFESSGTTGAVSSFHHVADPEIYRRSFTGSFSHFFGDPSEWMIAALLPSYEERGSSSLVYMVDQLIKMTGHEASGFYTDRTDLMAEELSRQVKRGGKAMLIGVTYALVDMAERGYNLQGVHVVETGGMKGRRREIIREELHTVLKKGLNITKVCSEYGMTELLSQAWSTGEGIFRTPPWMKVTIREFNDPLTLVGASGITGGVNVTDLANIYSCSFIATQDLGRVLDDGSFEILGRFDNSDIRGCNLLYQ
jgi:hypothetical protein